MLSLVAVLRQDARAALLWLVVAQVIDGIDGPIARWLRVDIVLPNLDGYTLDLVVDYVTCVVVPAAFLYRFQLVPGWAMMPSVSLVLFTSALWFSRKDMLTEDHWFRGWPAVWNLAVPCMYLAGTHHVINLVVLVLCASFTMTNLPFVHPLQVTDGRVFTAAVTVVWLITLVTLTMMLPRHTAWGDLFLLGPPCYYLGLTANRVREERRERASIGMSKKMRLTA